MSIEKNTSGLEEKNKPTEKHDDIKKKFLKDFLKDYTTGSNKSQQIELLNSIYTSDSVGNDLKTKMTQFKKEQYSGLELEKITLHDLKEVSLKAYVTLQNRRNKLKTIIQSKYDIDNNEYDQKIQKHIQELSFDDLSKHIDSCSGFLKTIYKDTLPNTKKYSSFLDTFDFSKRMRDTLSLLTKLTNEEKSILEELQYAREEGALFNSTELRQLFNIPFFNNEEKRELVHKCVGNITLRDATGLGIIDKNSQHYKDIKLYCIRAAGIKGLNDIDLEGISSSLSDNHILISTKHHCDGYSAVDKIASDILPEILEKQMKDARKQKEEELLEEGPQNAKELIQRVKIDKKLKEKITGIENFKENSFVQIEHKDSEGKTSYQAYKIGKVDQDIESGVPGFHFELFGGEKKGDTIEYVGGSGNQQKSYYDFCSVLSDMKDIQLNIITPDTLKEKEGQGAICFQQASSKFKLQDEYRERINSIEEELKKDDIDDLERDKLESEKNEYYNKSLESIINELDPEGEKYGFSKGVTFATQKDSQGKIGYYTVTGISDNMIDIQTAQGVNIPTMHFEDFLNAWEQEKPKRVSNVGDINGIFDSVKKNDKLGEKWGNFEQKDGKIFRKDGSEKQNYEYDFLVSENSKELIKIHAIHGDRVMIRFGKSEQKMDETKKGKGKMNTYFSVEDKIYDLHIGFLDNWIHKHQLIPRSLDEEKDIKETQGESVERHGSFWSRFFDRLSVADLLAGGKLYLDSIQNYLKEGQDELASRFANALWLPEELRNDMRARQDSAKKKRMDDYVTRLKEGNDAKEAVAMIVRWLLNKNAPEYKKEAGLTFMMEKYGVLYGKGPLMKYKGSFLWYEALGGKKGDELYNKIKEEEEARNQPFTEERLVWILLVKQCQPSGYNGIKRRSRFYKEIDGLIKKGYKDEVEDGSSKASSVRNHEDQVKSGMDELKGGNYPNAVGWMKGSMNKGGTVKNINKMPFIMLFSGEAYSMTEDSRNDIRGIPGREHHLVPILGFFSYNAQIKVFNNAVLRLCERIAEIKGNNKIFERAQGIFNNSTQLGNNLDRIEECEDFYNEYGELIMNCLYGLHIETSDNYLNHIIQIEKEDHIDKNGKKQQGNKAFKDYAKAYKEIDPIHLSDKNMDDQYKNAGWTGYKTQHAMEFALKVKGSGGTLQNEDSSINLMKELSDHIYYLAKDEQLDDIYKRRLIRTNIAALLGAVIKNGIPGLKSSNEIVVYLKKSYDISLDDLKEKEFSEHSILHHEKGSPEEEYINKIVDGIMNPKGDESDQDINEETKTGVDDILKKR